MEIYCSKNDLVNSVNIASKAVPTRTTMTILECILITVSNGKITLTSNDTEIGIETELKGDIKENGIVAIDAKLFSDVVRKLPEGIVHIKSGSDNIVNIHCEKSKFSIAGKDGNEFPYLEDVEKNDFITISQFTLKEVINQTIFSIAQNDNNKVMTGELFDINENRLRVISLDGHRISIRNIELRQSYPSMKVIIPGKTLSEISKILSGKIENVVNIFFTNTNAVFEFDNTVVVSRLIEGEYFDVDKMISNEYATNIKIDKKELADCIDRATLLVKENDKKPVIISITNDELELKINSPIGAMDETISIEKDGSDLMIGFNPRFLLDALRVIEDEKIEIYFMNSKAPCYIKDDNNRYNYMILPINFNTVG